MSNRGAAQAVQRTCHVPLWQQIERALLQDIRSGVLCEGMRLPSTRELALRFDVNRHTVRHALRSLELRGVLRTVNGCGSFVQEHPYRYLIGRRPRFGQAMSDINVATDYRLLESERCAAPAHVQRALRLVAGQPVQRLLYLTCVEERLVAHSEAWFPHARFAGIGAVFARERSITRSLAAFGVEDYLRQYTAVMAALPGPRIAHLLEQPAQRPVLHVQSINVDVHGVPVQFGDTCFAGQWMQLMIAPES